MRAASLIDESQASKLSMLRKPWKKSGKYMELIDEPLVLSLRHDGSSKSKWPVQVKPCPLRAVPLANVDVVVRIKHEDVSWEVGQTKLLVRTCDRPNEIGQYRAGESGRGLPVPAGCVCIQQEIRKKV